ncbi:MAG: hypothetical protein AAGI23_16990 [Bacteroidota bacterium]
MDKIFHSTFDFFTHALPGMCVVTALVLLDGDIQTFNDLLERAAPTTLGSAAVILLVSYVTGFAVYPFGRILYKKVGFKIWNRAIERDVPLHISEKYTLLRELSPSNFKYVELWNMFCAMAHNLAIASLILGGCAIIKAIKSPADKLSWIIVLIVSIIAFFIMLYRAVKFSLWAADDINSSIRVLDLQQKAKSKA